MKKSTSITFLLVLLLAPFLSFSINNSEEQSYIEDENLNINPCPTPIINYTDTTYTVDQSGHLVLTLYFTVNGVSYWATYDPITGQTTSNLPAYQNVAGYGPYGQPILVYTISSGPGCLGVTDTVYFEIPPGTTHCGPGTGNSGTNGNSSNGNGLGSGKPSSGKPGSGKPGSGKPSSDSDSDVTDSPISDGKSIVYPNPATEFVAVNFDLDNSSSDVYFVLLNQSGEVQLNMELTQRDQRIDVFHLKRGQYYYHLMNREGSIISGVLFLE